MNLRKIKPKPARGFVDPKPNTVKNTSGRVRVIFFRVTGNPHTSKTDEGVRNRHREKMSTIL